MKLMDRKIIKCPHCGCDSFEILREPEDGNNAECALCGCRFSLPLLTEDGGRPALNPAIFLRQASSWGGSMANEAYLGGVRDAFRVLEHLRDMEPELDIALGNFNLKRLADLDL